MVRVVLAGQVPVSSPSWIAPRLCEPGSGEWLVGISVSITVGEVRMTSDLRIATAFVLPLGGQGKEEALAALRRNTVEIRHQVVKGGTMKFAPELRFQIDGTFDQMDATRALLASDHVRRDLDE